MNDPRAVTLEVFAACPFSIAEEYAVEYFRRAESGTEEAVIHVPIAFFPAMLRRRVNVTFGLHEDVVDAGRPHDEIRIRWTSGTPLLPDFHGVIRFRIAGRGTDVLINGTYRVPFGAAGRVFDHFIGRHIAHASLADLARRLADALQENERTWSQRVRAS